MLIGVHMHMHTHTSASWAVEGVSSLALASSCAWKPSCEGGVKF